MVGVFVVIAASVGWLFFLVRIDENRKYKKLTQELIIFFVFGFIFSGIAYFVENWFGRVMDWIFVSPMFLSWFLSWFFVGFFEEGLKFSIMFVVLSGRKRVWEPKDIILFAAAVSLGFASLENIYSSLFVSIQIVELRSVISVIGHMSYSFIWALGLIIYLFKFYGEKRGKSLLLFSYVAAGFAHAFYDILIDWDGVSLSVAFSWDLVIVLAAILLFDIVVKESPYKKFRFDEADEAIKKIETSLLLNRNDYILNKKIAMFYIYKGMFDKALKALNVCLKQRPKDLYTRFYIALVNFILEPERGDRFQDLVDVAAFIESSSPKRLNLLKAKVLGLLEKSPVINEKIVERVGWVFSQFDPHSLMYGLYKPVGKD